MKTKELLQELVNTFERIEMIDQRRLEIESLMQQAQEDMFKVWRDRDRLDWSMRVKEREETAARMKRIDMFNDAIEERTRAAWAIEDEHARKVEARRKEWEMNDQGAKDVDVGESATSLPPDGITFK